MIELTPAAREQLDRYLLRIRSALRGSRTVLADEVEQSVREHVEVAVAGSSAPVDTDDINAVLERLGPPDRWLPEEERPAWRRMMDRIRTGPEDWRLAYVSFAMFTLMVVFFPVGGVLLLVPAFLVSRAYVEYLRGRGEAIGARRWLVYPAIATVLAFIAVIVLIVPIAGFIAWALEERGLEFSFGIAAPTTSRGAKAQFDLGVAVLAAGVWWMIASFLIALFIRPLRALVTPLLDKFERRHAVPLALIGIICAAAGAALLAFK